MTTRQIGTTCEAPASLAISVEANVCAANVMPELKQAGHARIQRMTVQAQRGTRTIMIMAGGTGGHIFGFGRASRREIAPRVTGALRRLACTEDVAPRSEACGGGHG